MSKIYSILGFPLLASATCGAFELPDYDMDTTLYEEALNRLDIHDLRLYPFGNPLFREFMVIRLDFITHKMPT